jgi:competence protein ComEC
MRLNSFYKTKPDDIRNFFSDQRIPAVVRGTVISRVRHEDRDKWVFGRYVFGDPSSSFYLKLTEAKFDSGFSAVSGKLRVQATDKIKHISPGDTVEMYCWLDRFEGPSNPGEFDVAKYLKGRGVFVAASVKSSDGIKLLEKDKSYGLYAALIKVREKLKLTTEAALLADGFWEESDQGLAAALLLGHRGKINSTTYDAFVRTGLAHFISLSGLHMGMLAGMIWAIATVAGLSKRWRAIVTIAIIGIYVMILPPRAPTMRAAMMCFFFCLSVLIRRKSNSLNAISLSAIVLLLIRPTDVFNAGWQLSYSTVLGIIILQERIWDKLLELAYFRFPYLQLHWDQNRFAHFAGKSVEYILATVSVGLAAWIGGAGVLLYHFGTVTPTACLWTPIVFPLVALILALGFFQIIISMLLPTLAIALSIIVESLSNVLAAMVEFIARIDNSNIVIGTVTIGVIILYYLGLFTWRFQRIRIPRLKRIVVLSAICLMCVPAMITSLSRDVQRHLEITCLDVGHGQAIVLNLPNSRNFLIDAGSLTRKNCGNRVVVPFLNDKGIGSIDAAFISHDDIDHLNGMPEILANVKAKNIYVSNAFIENAKTRSSAAFFQQWLQANNYRLDPLEALPTVKGLKITTLWPDEQTSMDQSISDNDKSQVFLIEYAGRSVLICSDIEKLAQQRILQKYPDLKADIVIMPHHGSTTNLSDNFFEKLSAKALIASCSQTRYKTAYKNDSIKTWYTASDGAVTVTIKKDSNFSIKGFVSPRRI